MLVSTTVVSTRILRPGANPLPCAIFTTLSCTCLITSGPRAKPQRPMVLASGAFALPTRVNSRYTRLARTSRSSTAVTPVADVLEDQQAQDYFGRSSQPAAVAASGVPLGQRFVYRRHDLSS